MIDRSPVIFDTSIYVAAIRGGLLSSAFRLLQESLPRTYLSSVVSAELHAGCTTEAARRAVHEFTLRAQRVRRVVTPSHTTWERAGDILARIRRTEPALRTKLTTLWNDVLVALSSRDIGARVVSYDTRDFSLIRRYILFELQEPPVS